MEDLLCIKHLVLRQQFSSGQVYLVDDVNLSLQKQRPLTLIGESGCGKSLLGQAVLGIVPRNILAEGEIIYRGVNLLSDRKGARKLWGREIFLFPQEPGRYLNPLIICRSQVSEIFRKVYQDKKEIAQQQGRKMLQAVNLLGEDQKKYPWQLSGGMGQRLLAAISLALPARVIVADEPTKGLDDEMKFQVISMLKKVSDSGKGLLTITHDLHVPKVLGGDIAVMYNGKIVELGPAEILLENPKHPYTIALHNALPKNGLKPIPRKIHENGTDAGCAFVSRCTKAEKRCFTSYPHLSASANWRHSIACYQAFAS